jgi:hypothetical protein
MTYSISSLKVVLFSKYRDKVELNLFFLILKVEDNVSL